MRCSVIIPTRHRPGLLRKTLESLHQQTERDFDVVVVVDGEDAATHSLANEYQSPYALHWIFAPEHKGQASARNAGSAAAQSEILLFLDDDTTPDPEWIHHHLKYHRANTSQNAIGVLGKVIDRYLRPPRTRTEHYLRDSRNETMDRFEEYFQNNSLELGKGISFGLNCSLPRQTFLALGGFDPELDYIGEDFDLGARIYDSGLPCKYEPAAVVYHHDTKDGLDYYYSIVRSGGPCDVYRRRHKQHRNDRIQLLSQLHYGSPTRRQIHRVAWHCPWLFHLAEVLSKKITDATGSELSFRLWYKMAVGEYWKSVRSAGETIDSLRDLFPARAPILMLHSVTAPSEQNQKSYYLAPHRFSRFMEWLKRAGYVTTLPTEWLTPSYTGRRVILTFDDAYDDFWTEALPVLDRLGFKATLFVVADRMGKTNTWDEPLGFRSRRLLPLEQIRSLHRRGMHIGSHTLTHPRLTALPDRDLEREVRDSKLKLEDLLGTEIPCFSYPWGEVDTRVRAAVARAGYRVAVTTEEGLNGWQDPLALKRVNVCDIDTLFEFRLKVVTGKDYRQLAKAYLVKRGLYPRAGGTEPILAEAEHQATSAVAPPVVDSKP